MCFFEVMLLTHHCHNAACRCSNTSCNTSAPGGAPRLAALPDSLSPDAAAAVADEAVYLGLPELQRASMRMRRTGKCVYDSKSYNLDAQENSVYDTTPAVKSGWELFSAHLSCTGGFRSLCVICKRLKPLCNE